MILFAALAGKAEADLVPAYGSVAALQRRQAVGVVLSGIVVISHSDEGGLQQVDDSCQRLFPR